MAFRRLGYWYGYYVHDADISVNSERIPYVDLIEKLEDGEDVPADQLVWALESGHLNVDPDPIRETLQEAIRKQLAADEGEE